MSTEMLDVLSVLDDQDNPVLGNCTLILGEVALEFKNGRSKISKRFAPEVARCAKVTIPGYTGPVALPVPSVSAGLPSGEPEQSPAEIAAEYLREQGLEVPVFNASPPPEGTVEIEDGMTAEDVQTAAETLQPETTEQPAVEVAKINSLPDGFEPLTAAGEPRCFARTGSGTQCSNPAVSGSNACGLGAHKEQVG